MTRKKVAIIGANGQVGYQLIKVLSQQENIEVIPVDRSILNLEDTISIKPYLSTLKPDILINAAAYTAVDKAEKEKEEAESINASAPAMMAEYAADTGIPFVHYSTDYVFDGEHDVPYLESDPVSPQSVYGATKLQGEEAIVTSGSNYLILRTSWVYGLHGHNFLLTMLKLFKQRDELSIVNDQVGAPTSAFAIATATAEIINRLDTSSLDTLSGIYHLTAAGETSWYGFAEAILAAVASENYQCQLHPITSIQYPTPAKRPAYSVLDNRKLNSAFGIVLPGWQEQLEAVIREWHKSA